MVSGACSDQSTDVCSATGDRLVTIPPFFCNTRDLSFGLQSMLPGVSDGICYLGGHACLGFTYLLEGTVSQTEPYNQLKWWHVQNPRF